ncbi:hypothetical protein SAMN04488065_0651 [Haloplanus vescus]|uniref:HTH bat-type domain-containing protein n=1 Tax=Haloplanus vescus TaxID=555874 RepID=A0A1H3W8F5_9EURY|nr:helix-turn-helix domain-containing protein [Haloplanus vescus]SDZ83357.1 hypothetical protein SAMN04488065_0651 [Haloplanus vescus]
MASGLRIDLNVSDPGTCPVARVSGESDTPARSVSRASIPDSEGRIAEEFTVGASATVPESGVSEVASYDSHTVYRFRRSREQPCVCERVETFGYPVSDVHATDGSLAITFHAPDLDAVQAIVSDLRERFGGIELRKLTEVDGDSTDLVFVDRSRLTARQREVVRAAYDMGYFEHPKRSNAGEVASELDVSRATFREHLAAAQRKLLDAILNA